MASEGGANQAEKIREKLKAKFHRVFDDGITFNILDDDRMIKGYWKVSRSSDDIHSWNF